MYGLSLSSEHLGKCWSFEWGRCYKIRWVTIKMNSFRETMRPSSVINAFTSSQPDSLHQALFICNLRTSWSYLRLISIEAAAKHASTVRMDSNNFTSAQHNSTLAHVCAMRQPRVFCVGAMDYILWSHLWIPEIVGIHGLRCKRLINGRWNPHG